MKKNNLKKLKMKTEKKSTKKKDSKSKQSNENINSGNTLSIGELDLIFEINFTDKDLENPNPENESKKYYKLENINTLSDLSFISSLPQDFINNIKLKPNNHLIRQLLLGNKISKKKNSVELICYNLPTFENDNEAFFQKIFEQVCINYKLNINKKPLHQEGRYSLILKLKHKNENKEITIGQTPQTFKKEKMQKEKEKRDSDELEENKKEEKDKSERETKKKEKIESYKEEREKSKDGLNKGDSKINKNNKNQSRSPNKAGSPNKKIKQKNKKKELQNNDSSGEEEDNQQEDEDYEINEAMKEKKIPKFSRKNSVLCNLSPMNTKYDLIYLNYETLKSIPGDFKMKDFIELLLFFKKKKIFIFINFYKEELEGDELKEEQKIQEAINNKDERKKEKEKNYLEEKQKKEKEINNIKSQIIILKEKKNDIEENKKLEIVSMSQKKKEEEINKIETELNDLENSLIEKEDDLRAENEVDIEFKKREEQAKKAEEKELKKEEKKKIKLINEIFYLVDGYFFDSKQACEIFTKHYLCYTNDTDKTKKINRQKLYDYFITVISRGRRPSIDGKKLGLFLDDFNNYNIIYISKKAANKQELNPQPYPKVNPHNITLINKYKDILMKFKNDYYDVFICLPAHEISANHGNFSTEIIYPTFLAGLDIIKRQVEIAKNGIESYDEDLIYKVKISDKALKQELEKLAIDGKEGNFVLDCTNKNKSALKDYVSLFDYNLKDFFSSDIIRKNLQDKGFINSEGYIMYDPLYRDILGAKSKNQKKYKGEELKSQIISNIKNIDVPARLKDKEYDPKKAVENQIVPTNKKIPFIKPKKKKKRRRDGKSSEGEGYSSEGEKSKSDNEGNSEDNEKNNI